MKPRNEPIKPVKIVLIGNAKSKRDFVNNLQIQTDDYKNSPANTKSIIGVEFKMIKHEGVNYQVWDTSGQERFLSSYKNMLNGVDGVIFINATSEQQEAVIKDLNQLSDNSVPVIDYLKSDDVTPLHHLVQVNQVKIVKEDIIEQKKALERQKLFPATIDKVNPYRYLAKENKVTHSLHNKL